MKMCLGNKPFWLCVYARGSFVLLSILPLFPLLSIQLQITFLISYF